MQAYRQPKTHRQLRGKEWFTHAIIHTCFEKAQALLQVQVARKNEQGCIRVFLAQVLNQDQGVFKDKRIRVDQNARVLREPGKQQTLFGGNNRLDNKLCRTERPVDSPFKIAAG